MGKYNKDVKANFTYMASDFVVGILAAVLAGFFTKIDIFQFDGRHIILCVGFNLICIFMNKGAKLYNITLFFYPDRIFKLITRSFILTTAIVTTLIFYVGNANIEKNFFLIFLLYEYIFLMLSAYLERLIRKNNNRLNPRTLLLGDKEKYMKFVSFIEKSNMNLNIIGYVSLDECEGYLGKADDLEEIVHDNAIDYVYIMDSKNDETDFKPYVDSCIDMGITVGLIVDHDRNIDAHSYISSIGTYPMITYHTVVLNSGAKVMKRVMDVLGSFIAILLFSPIMLIASIAIKIEDLQGPVVFKQIRVGQNGRQFYMYKFRSMCTDAEEKKKELMDMNEMDDEYMFKIKDDPRMTKVGKFLRKSNIDELPQLFNVLKGDMSMVGTRPPTLDEVAKYKRNYWRRVSIKSGITGMWQVSGRSNITDFEKVVELDMIYIDEWNILLDIKIILKTVLKMILRKNDSY
jgi:exopolysaccharide biosynthesis polyprenyl glycosylphosphotransferase